MTNKLKMTWKQVVMPHFKVLFCHLLGEPSIRITIISAHTRTGHLPIASQKYYHLRQIAQ